MLSIERTLFLFILPVLINLGISCKKYNKVDLYVDELYSKDKKTRISAAYKIAFLGKEARPAILALRETLNDPDRDIKEAVITSIFILGLIAAEALPNAFNELEKDQTLFKKGEYFFDISQMGPDVIPIIIKELEESNGKKPRLKRNAISAFSLMGPSAKASVPYIIKYLNDNDGDIRNDTIISLEVIGLKKKYIPILIKSLEHNEYVDSRKFLFRILSTFGDDARGALPLIISEIYDGPNESKLGAVIALWKIGPSNPCGISAVVNSLNNIQDEYLDIIICSYLIGLKLEDIKDNDAKMLISFLRKGLISKNKTRKRIAHKICENMGKLSAPLVDILINDLNSPHVYTLQIIENIGESAVPKLIDALINCNEDRKRLNIKWSLTKIGKNAVQYLIKIISNSKVQIDVIEILGDIGPDARCALKYLTVLKEKTDDLLLKSYIADAIKKIIK